MIKGLTSIYRPIRSGKIHLGIKKTKVVNGKTVEYPSECDNFILRDAPELKKIYGEETHILHISLPSARFEKEDFQLYLDRVFPQFLKMYRSSGLYCKGDGETAVRVNDDTGKLEERECPCAYFESGQCKKIGIFRFRINSIASLNVYQITTGSFNSLVNINSFCRDLLEHCIVHNVDISSVKLVLTRREESTQHISEGKTHKGKHFIMMLDLDPRFYKTLDDVRGPARLPDHKVPELPAPDETRDPLFFPDEPAAEKGSESTDNDKDEDSEEEGEGKEEEKKPQADSLDRRRLDLLDLVARFEKAGGKIGPKMAARLKQIDTMKEMALSSAIDYFVVANEALKGKVLK